MDPDKAGRGEGHHIAGFFQSHWLLFILLGGLLIAAGGVAIVVPAISSIAPNEVLGLVLIFVGIVQIAQSGKMKGEGQFAWHLTLGLVAAIGGVFVYLDPFEGVVTLTILMAIVFALHGLTQIAFAFRVRHLKGWSWFLLSGCVALLVAALLEMKLPYGHAFTPATVGGVSLLFAGWAYIALARVGRQAP
ncbi:MAG: HdeD family acid-resistance protein [Reyranella sp.]